MIDRKSYTYVNSKAWDDWVENGIEWGVPISHDEYMRVFEGLWEVYLTPVRAVPKEWFLPFKASRILGLACGGTQQMPVFCALGAECTVFDNSDRQLESERLVAEREGYNISIIKGDMTRRLPFEDKSFDMIFHPVSNCYIEDVYHVWNECFRVLRSGGALIAGMSNGICYMFDDDGLTVKNKLPFNPLNDPALMEKLIESNDGVQFSHSLEEQIGGQLRAGFMLSDLYEDHDRPGCSLISEYAPTYLATRAVKP